MNNNNELTRMEEALRNDTELQKKYEETCKKIAESGNAKNDIEVMVKAAAELGYTITPEDSTRRLAGNEEIDLDELNTVTGGMESCSGEWFDDDKGHDGFCWSAWHCTMVTLHTETETKNVKCFSDYRCNLIYHFLK